MAVFITVVSRDENGHISLEELDQIQADIEILLASVGKRLKQLGSENNILATWPDKKDGKRSTGKGVCFLPLSVLFYSFLLVHNII